MILVKNIAKDLGKNVSELIGNTSVLNQIDLHKYVTDTVGLPTLKDIITELEKPGLDPREKAKAFSFNQVFVRFGGFRDDYYLGAFLCDYSLSDISC